MPNAIRSYTTPYDSFVIEWRYRSETQTFEYCYSGAYVKVDRLQLLHSIEVMPQEEQLFVGDATCLLRRINAALTMLKCKHGVASRTSVLYYRFLYETIIVQWAQLTAGITNEKVTNEKVIEV